MATKEEILESISSMSVLEKVSKEDAEKAKAALEGAGATVEVR